MFNHANCTSNNSNLFCSLDDKLNRANDDDDDDGDQLHFPLPVLIGASVCSGEKKSTECRVTPKLMMMRKKQCRGIFNPATISTVLILSFISNQSITIILSAGRNLTGSNDEHYRAINGDTAKVLIGRSLVNMVAASPSPEPSGAVVRSASSGSHRLPPMNGSIFGKRSLNGNNKQTNNESSQNNKAKSNEDTNQAPIIDHSTQILEQQNDQPSGSFSKPQLVKSTTRPSFSSSSSSTLLDSTGKATNYKDIITETIENFLSLNNESDPEEATVAFCRMIVYECKQMLSARSIARRQRKRVNQRTI